MLHCFLYVHGNIYTDIKEKEIYCTRVIGLRQSAGPFPYNFSNISDKLHEDSKQNSQKEVVVLCLGVFVVVLYLK